MADNITNPKVFISYAWGSEEYQEKVLSFAEELVRTGVDVVIDKWDLKEGNDTYAFMETCVRDVSITNVLILLDPIYEQKANVRSGGVGTETQIISAETYNKVQQDRFLPVIFERNEDGSIPKPTYLKGLLHFDLTNADSYDQEFQRLVRSLYGIDTYVKPELGPRPAWLESAPRTSAKTKNIFRELRREGIDSKRKQAVFRSHLSDLSSRFIEYEKDSAFDVNNYEIYLQRFENIIPLRNEFLESFQQVPFVDSGERIIIDYLEEISNQLDSLESPFEVVQIKKTVLYELFIYLIALYYRSRNYGALSYTFNRTYFNSGRGKYSEAKSYDMFRINNSNLSNAVNKRDQEGNIRYYNGTAHYWIEHINVDICSKDDFVFADTLCYNASLLIDNYEGFYWFPITYIYGSDRVFPQFANRLLSREHLIEFEEILGLSHDSFINKYKSIEARIENGSLREYRYGECFESAPLVMYFIKSDELGIKP